MMSIMVITVLVILVRVYLFTIHYHCKKEEKVEPEQTFCKRMKIIHLWNNKRQSK